MGCGCGCGCFVLGFFFFYIVPKPVVVKYLTVPSQGTVPSADGNHNRNHNDNQVLIIMIIIMSVKAEVAGDILTTLLPPLPTLLLGNRSRHGYCVPLLFLLTTEVGVDDEMK